MAGNVAPNTVTNGLVLYLDAGNTNSYPGTGTAWNDISGNRNNGTLTNGPTFNSSNGGNIVFDGIDDYGTTLLTRTGTNNCTISVWYRWNGSSSVSFITYLGNQSGTGMGLILGGGVIGGQIPFGRVGLIYGGITYTATNTTITMTSNVWANYVITRDTTTTTLYHNGVFNGSTTLTPNGNASTLNYILGGGPGAGGNYGSFIFYNRALSSQEILQNYNALKGRYGL
jgi:hypothetical protein